MAENVEYPPEPGTRAYGADLETPLRMLIDSLRNSEKLRGLGLTGDVVPVVRSVLCALWRNMSLPELDVLRGVLPASIDLMFASCDLPHGRRAPPRIFDRAGFETDVAEHLTLPRDQALTAAGAVIDALRAVSDEHEFDNGTLFYDSPELKSLLRCPP